MSTAPIKMLECSGTPRQMGEQHGEAAQAEIRQNCVMFQLNWLAEESREPEAGEAGR